MQASQQMELSLRVHAADLCGAAARDARGILRSVPAASATNSNLLAKLCFTDADLRCATICALCG